MTEGSALPQPGETIAGKYVLERVIGEGGMSVVYGATHRVTGKRFAIKWMLPDQTPTSGDTARRFIREAQVAGLFQHPNVVEVYDVGEVSGSFYMVMEWLDGESLASRLERCGAMSFADVCAYMIPCMHGVSEAHGAGIVHRDLKPANIFLCRAMHHTPERPKVLDFGIAKITAPAFNVSALVTKSGMLIGTPHYLSPEQLRSQPVDHRTDVYAFGVIMYQLLTNTLPFPATNFGALALQIASGTPFPLQQIVPDLPAGMAEVVACAMALEPNERFQSVRELSDALLALRAGEVPRMPAGRMSPAPERASAPRVGPPPLPPKTSQPPAAEAVSPIASPSASASTNASPRRKLWRYAPFAALLLGAAGFLIAWMWREAPEAGAAANTGAHASPNADSGANKETVVTSTAAATSPATHDLAPVAPAAPAQDAKTQAVAPEVGPHPQAELAREVASPARAKRARPTADPPPAPPPTPSESPGPSPAVPPVERNPLHMKLQ